MSLQKYTVIAAMGCGVPAGSRLGLTDKQARRRLHALVRVKKNIYRTTQKVSFKCGEIIGFDGDVNKILMTSLAPASTKNETAEPESGPEPDGEAGPEPTPDPEP